MREPCLSCPRREIGFGGCRCQALALTDDARKTDPVCVYSPARALVTAALGGGASRRGRVRLSALRCEKARSAPTTWPSRRNLRSPRRPDPRGRRGYKTASADPCPELALFEGLSEEAFAAGLDELGDRYEMLPENVPVPLPEHPLDERKWRAREGPPGWALSPDRGLRASAFDPTIAPGPQEASQSSGDHEHAHHRAFGGDRRGGADRPCRAGARRRRQGRPSRRTTTRA